MNERLTILSTNLRSGGAKPGALANLITDNSVDIVCAQELSFELAAVLSDLLSYGDLSHDQIHRGNGIAGRYLIETRRVSMPKRDGWVAKLSPQEWPTLEFPIEVVNVHISGPHVWPYFPNPVRRRKQLAALLRDREGSRDVAHTVLGDFNSSPIWPVYKEMSASYGDAVLDAKKEGAQRDATWPNFPWLGIEGLIRIDHCFLWRLSAKRTQVVRVPGSDHLGLLVEIDIS